MLPACCGTRREAPSWRSSWGADTSERATRAGCCVKHRARFVECSMSKHRPPHPALSPSTGERVPKVSLSLGGGEGRGEGGVVSNVALMTVLICLCTLFASVARADESIWEAVRMPGAVVVLRHSYAPGSFDPPTARLDDCSTQRNLDANGRAQAERVGEAFRRNDVTVGPVLSSPRCRCLETGRLAFGRAEAWNALEGSLNDRERRERQIEAIKARTARHRDGPPLVLVTHGSVVTDLTGLAIRMGEIVVLRPAADGGFEVADRLYVD